MNDIDISLKSALKAGWVTFVSHWGLCMGALALCWFTIFVPGLIATNLAHSHSLLAGLFRIIQFLMNLFVWLGFIAICLKISDTKPAYLSDLFKQTAVLWSFFLANCLYGLVVFAGLILLIFPAVIWGIQYSFYVYFIVDRKMKPVQAFHASSRLTKSFKWRLLWIYLALALVNIAGLLLLLVGLLVTIPLSILVHVYIYRQLLAHQQRDRHLIAETI